MQGMYPASTWNEYKNTFYITPFTQFSVTKAADMLTSVK